MGSPDYPSLTPSFLEATKEGRRDRSRFRIDVAAMYKTTKSQVLGLARMINLLPPQFSNTSPHAAGISLTMPASIKSAAVIVWISLLLSPVVRAAYTRDGDGWNYFEQYVHSASKPENAFDRPASRQLGTFWNTKMAKDYDVTKALGGKKCGVAFYFPEMPRRFDKVPDEANKSQLTEEPTDWNRDKGSIEVPDYRRPLSISGVCEGFEPTKGKNDYPRYFIDLPDTVTVDSVVFHNLHPDASRDAYVTIR